VRKQGHNIEPGVQPFLFLLKISNLLRFPSAAGLVHQILTKSQFYLVSMPFESRVNNAHFELKSGVSADQKRSNKVKSSLKATHIANKIKQHVYCALPGFYHDRLFQLEVE
jgi:hypothetical protein